MYSQTVFEFQSTNQRSGFMRWCQSGAIHGRTEKWCLGTSERRCIVNFRNSEDAMLARLIYGEHVKYNFTGKAVQPENIHYSLMCRALVKVLDKERKYVYNIY